MPNISQSLPNPGILKDVQILVVDNDADTRYLCSILFESYGAKVTTFELVTDALALLDCFAPDILICETRFLNEDVWPLIQRVKAMALDLRRVIPILVASAYRPGKSEQALTQKVEVHLLKPIDIDRLVDEVWNLIHLAKSTSQPNIQDWVINHRRWSKRHLAEANSI
jgi:CheY-like chemotaxis protein